MTYIKNKEHCNISCQSRIFLKCSGYFICFSLGYVAGGVTQGFIRPSSLISKDEILNQPTLMGSLADFKTLAGKNASQEKEYKKVLKRFIYLTNQFISRQGFFLKLNFTLLLLNAVLHFPSFFFINTFPNDLISKLNIGEL